MNLCTNKLRAVSYKRTLILGCISLVKSKIGLLREITRTLFCERNKKSKKRLIADKSLWKKRKIQKRIFPSRQLITCSIVKTPDHMDFFRIISQRNTKSWILRIRIRINPLNLRRARIHWIHNPFLDFAKETKNPFLDSKSRLGFFPKKCTLFSYRFSRFDGRKY